MKPAVQLACRLFLMVLGAFLLLHVLFLSTFISINSGMILTFLVGFFCMLFAVFFKKISRTKGARWLLWAFGGFCFFMAAMIVFLSLYGGWDTADYQEDAVVVLGAGVVGETVTSPLAYRLDACIEYCRGNPKAVVVVSGGQGRYEEIPEALAMKRYLVGRGISAQRIIMEDRSKNTGENLKFTKQLLDETLQTPYRITVVTNQFHVFRGVQLAKIAGFSDVTHLHAGLDFYNIPVSYIREVFGVLKMWVLQR